MTICEGAKDMLMILPASMASQQGPHSLFSLPHSSNNASKKRVTLIEPKAGEIYELRRHQFSKGSSFNTQSDLAAEKYHYTANQEPLKSTFLTNEADRKDGRVMEAGDIHFATRFDLSYCLIGYYYGDSTSQDEKEYEQDSEAESAVARGRMNCLTVRDYHDHLVDNHDSQWANVSLESLEMALRKVAEPTEEAGSTFYKLTEGKIIEYLANKVTRLAQNLPKSLNISADLPADILECAKVTLAADLLVSLIPKHTYFRLKRFSPAAGAEHIADIKNSCDRYETYKRSVKQSVEEKELLVKAAMTVGLPTGKTKTSVVKKVTKKSVVVRKQKGSIDGFFKPAKRANPSANP
ncbi:hypothetical protein HG536_0E03500 [Torulaspora globosa]|uniref:Ribonuclease H2 subunit B n=1 Tax=Torulaspora globosa TaxID=48254 RepID=A0A7G3ZIV3_9SACH|nr:uncharacterized protein HG536_0E03500 [Torulaspora globosa]QLL33439.1 hypothetical protein HG536_0E03500 [Torulaspora globosa]